MRDALLQRGGFSASSIQALQGTRVNMQEVEAAISDGARRFNGTSNLLVVYFTGHAYVDAASSPVFFTYFTRDGPGGAFEQVIPRNQIHEWLARAKVAARDRGAQFSAVLIVDACRIRLMVPPPSASITPAADWEWYGTEEGRFAEAPVGDDPSPFTAALVSAMEQLSRDGEANADQVFDVTRRLTIDRTSDRQRPQILRPEGVRETPVLVQANRVALGVRVLDAVTGPTVPGAEVQVGQRRLTGERVIQLSPGSHLIRVRATGYLTRSEEVEIGPERSGQVLEIPLHRALVVVRGSTAPPRVVSVRWRGEGAVRDYHSTAMTSGSDGSFALRLPPTAAGTAIEVLVGGEVVRTVAVPQAPTRLERPRGTAYEGVPVFDLGELALPAAGSLSLGEILGRYAGEARNVRVPLPATISDSAFRSLPQLSPIASGQLRNARDRVGQGRWQLARQNLVEVLSGSEIIEARARNALDGALAWVAAREVTTVGTPENAERVASELTRFPLAELAARAALVQIAAERADRVAHDASSDQARTLDALSALQQAFSWGGAEELGWRPVVAYGREQYVRTVAHVVSRLVTAQRWMDALDILDRVRSIPGTDSLARQVEPPALRGALEEAIALGIRTGDWASGQALATRVRRTASRDSGLVALARTVDNEAIPLETRQRYERSHRMRAEGRLEEAWEEYGRALEHANTRYRQLIEAQREDLRQLLFIDRLRRGEAALIDRDSTRALEEYLRASRYDFRVDNRIRALRGAGVRGDSAMLADWQRRQEALTARPSAILVRTDPPGRDVWINGVLVGRAPLIHSLTARTEAEVEIRFGTWRSRRVRVDALPDRGVEVSFAAPSDTLRWPAPRPREQIIREEGLEGRFRPSTAQPSQPPAPRSKAAPTVRLLLATAGAAGGGFGLAQAFADKPDSTRELAIGGGVLAGAVVGYFIGRAIDRGFHGAAVRRYNAHPERVAEWQARINREHQEFLDREVARVVRNDQPRFDAERRRVRARNDSTRARNATVLQREPQVSLRSLSELWLPPAEGPPAPIAEPTRPRPTPPEQLRDSDGDGVLDFWDSCSNTARGATVDQWGCPVANRLPPAYLPDDADTDGVPDPRDRCASTPRGATVDVRGCPSDTDRDGVLNGLDRCPDTPPNTPVDFSGCTSDTDGDGVADNLDRCPNTPSSVRVDSNGCWVDSDRDGVPDSQDRCANTPAGMPVDANGCPRDSDGDGVMDNLDRCWHTAPRTAVDATGCPRDSDGDGVHDGADRCPNTAAGTQVDANGCPVQRDADSDGVVDANDRCPSTPAGRRVDANGCPLAELPQVGQAMVVRNVLFRSGTAVLTPSSRPTLDGIATAILATPNSRWEVGGHTDSRGVAATNQRFSQARAQAVIDYLVSRGLSRDALTAVAYGSTRPVAPNTTNAGRAQNRRIELRRLQ